MDSENRFCTAASYTPPVSSLNARSIVPTGAFSGPSYLLAKTLVELPPDMAFAALFGVVVKQQCGLGAKTAEISAAYALTALRPRRSG